MLKREITMENIKAKIEENFTGHGNGANCVVDLKDAFMTGLPEGLTPELVQAFYDYESKFMVEAADTLSRSAIDKAVEINDGYCSVAVNGLLPNDTTLSTGVTKMSDGPSFTIVIEKGGLGAMEEIVHHAKGVVETVLKD